MLKQQITLHLWDNLQGMNRAIPNYRLSYKSLLVCWLKELSFHPYTKGINKVGCIFMEHPSSFGKDDWTWED
ncbi:hypothetical protein [Paenibacillus taichungensis]